jgi:hypothetical protein
VRIWLVFILFILFYFIYFIYFIFFASPLGSGNPGHSHQHLVRQPTCSHLPRGTLVENKKIPKLPYASQIVSSALGFAKKCYLLGQRGELQVSSMGVQVQLQLTKLAIRMLALISSTFWQTPELRTRYEMRMAILGFSYFPPESPLAGVNKWVDEPNVGVNAQGYRTPRGRQKKIK